MFSLAILIYAETDLQHASFWCKSLNSEDKTELLSHFQAAWRYVNYRSFIINLTFFNERYALAHLQMKCRRKVILEYFGENTNDETCCEQHCCDVCQETQHQSTKDCKDEMVAIVKAVRQIPNKGEKKVCI